MKFSDDMCFKMITSYLFLYKQRKVSLRQTINPHLLHSADSSMLTCNWKNIQLTKAGGHVSIRTSGDVKKLFADLARKYNIPICYQVRKTFFNKSEYYQEMRGFISMILKNNPGRSVVPSISFRISIKADGELCMSLGSGWTKHPITLDLVFNELMSK